MKFKNKNNLKIKKIKNQDKNIIFKKTKHQTYQNQQINQSFRQDQSNHQPNNYQQKIQQIQQNQHQSQLQQNQSIEEQQISEAIDEGNQQIDLLVNNQGNLQQYQQEISNRGVVYLSRVPPFMTPNFIRKLLASYNVQRIYLLPQSQWVRKNRIKKGGSKRISFREGWIQFAQKKVAKNVALTLNGQKMVHKKGTFYSQDVWNLKYLPKFKWHNLTQRLAHEQRMKKEQLRLQMEQQRKLHQYYSNQVYKSSKIKGIIKSKASKGKELKITPKRQFQQRRALQQQRD